jgi:hypothetical protein
MKKNCEYTRKSLKKYLHGHLFKTQKIRIDRHLNSCVVCRSEFEALKHAEDTRSFLRDITPPESVAQQVREGISSLARLKKVVYRPLWIAAILLVAAAVYYYVITPRRLDVELENIVRTTSSSTTPTAAAQPSVAVSSATNSTPALAVIAQAAAPASAGEPVRAIEPLTVTITIGQANEKTAIRQLNEVLRGHAQLRKKKFSDEVREISGSLTSKELLVLFDRIEETGKAGYSRKRLQSFPSAQPIPFVLKLKTAPRAVEKPTSTAKPVQKPAENPVEALVPVPVQPATAPTPSPAQ